MTRLHVRYDAERFPEDLVFQETSNRQNFQGRYVLRHKATGDLSCQAGQNYLKQLYKRQEKEAATLASLTGWSMAEIRRKSGLGARGPQGSIKLPPKKKAPWWKRLWDR